ncbi:MAG: hypothetical protein J5927_05530, partial [Oscillospiraceae bacterium]|nr:hypothetical protein [Oscillospiraceae bacterium]
MKNVIRWIHKRRGVPALLLCALLFSLGSPAARAEGLSDAMDSLRDARQTLTDTLSEEAARRQELD